MGTLISQNVAYNHDFRGVRFHWLFGWYIKQPQWGYDGDIMEIYGGECSNGILYINKMQWVCLKIADTRKWGW